MTKTECEFLQNKIAEVIELASVNKSLEYMVFVHDNYLTEMEKNIIDIDGVVIHATKNNDLIISKLDEISNRIYKISRDQEGDL